MNKNKTLLIAIIILILILGGAYFLYGKLGSQVERENLVAENTTAADETENDKEDEKVSAPDFTVTDNDGNEVKLSDFEGKPVVVNFWASWCGPCKAEMPEFEEAYKKYGENIHFLMVNSTDGSQETVETAKEFIVSEGYTFPVYYDTLAECAYGYGVTGIPMTFFIDKDGNLVSGKSGMISAADLDRRILTIVG